MIVGKKDWINIAVQELQEKINLFSCLPPTPSLPWFPSTAATLPNTLSQQRNLALFRAFCAMKYAIYALCVNSHRHAKCKDCVHSLLGDIPEDAAFGEPAGDWPPFSGSVMCASPVAGLCVIT